ncbi:hypothetical protein LAZ67_3002685 [Cordylochernes scorpioides]|uniref:Uncharacterized protein n=1 Tax=Cordylochernes scorpioides TaxID=51811 RepID=A0ABY6KAV6_9ARAC|nr:hypothetical protein LAZ67_3002685 [Cordylochernes scorpioides]
MDQGVIESVKRKKIIATCGSDGGKSWKKCTATVQRNILEERWNNLSLHLKSYQTANLYQSWLISLQNLLYLKIVTRIYSRLAGCRVDYQGSSDNEEELRDDDQVEKGPPNEEVFHGLRQKLSG